IDPERLMRFHAIKRAAATMTVTYQEDRQDTGSVMLSEDDRVLSMVEKPHVRSTGYDNAGIYVFDRAIESRFPAKSPWSLERDLLPQLVTEGLYGFVTASPLYDIGTPERLAHFRQVWKETSVHLPHHSPYHPQGSTS
ncbi:MAG TPA: sugar phosphate nucleotidyltransferase, partial [Nitrospira sp.]|nr:sugar phosphate nucleotidyltransferase [Nitrospira sp.]